LPVTTVTHATSGLAINQIRNRAAAVSITPVTQTASGAHSDGGFVHVAGGLYRVDTTDATVASGADSAQVVVSGVTDVVFTVARIEILGANPRSATADVNVVKMNNTTVVGAGTSGDKWRA
jgi:hypothetical protein